MKRVVFKFILLFSICAFCVTAANANIIYPVKSANTPISLKEVSDDDCYEESDIIKRVGLKDKFKRSEESKILSFMKKHAKYADKNDFNKLNEFYTEDYVNNDGMDKKAIFEIMKNAAKEYKETETETEAESIKISGNYAEVCIHEVMRGVTTSMAESIKDYGTIYSESRYIDYLRKENNQWKISATTVLSEEVSMKYGEAKYMDVVFDAPECVPEDSEYEAGIKTILPGGTFVVGSIVNDEIIHPLVTQQDIYRNIKADELIRVLRSNKNGHNEYVTASIGITRAKVEPPSVMLNMTGIAFYMKRVNVIQKDKK